jgi:hypothetical protein
MFDERQTILFNFLYFFLITKLPCKQTDSLYKLENRMWEFHAIFFYRGLEKSRELQHCLKDVLTSMHGMFSVFIEFLCVNHWVIKYCKRTWALLKRCFDFIIMFHVCIFKKKFLC